jgi:hypothetical protein
MWNNKTISAVDSTDVDGIIVNWTWNITIYPANNNTNATTYWFYGENFTFRFNIEGNVTITLTVTDDDGLTNTTTVFYDIVNPNKEVFNLLILLIPLVIILLIVAVVFIRNKLLLGDSQ